MHAEWPIVRLGDVASILTGFPFKSQSYLDDPDAFRLLRGDNIAQGWLRWDGLKRWPRNQVTGLEDYWLATGDIVLAMDRPWIEAGLKYACVSPHDLPSLLVQRVARLRGSSRLELGFLRYLIGSRPFTDYIRGIETGTAVPHISGDQIRDYKFTLPPLPVQNAAASLLNALDGKISLNQRMCETLESMAQAIFRDWFIDFGPTQTQMEGGTPYLAPELWSLFPAGLDSDEKPEGWQALPLDEMADFLNGLALQKFPGTDDGDLPVIKIAELRTGVTSNSGRASSSIPQQYVVEDGDILFSWSGSLVQKVWTGGRGALNQHLFKVTSQNFPKWLHYFWVDHHLPAFRAIAASKATTMGHIQRHHLSEARVIVGDRRVMWAADKIVCPMFEQLVSNALESRTLAQTRDLLLPKLMSGEVRIKEAEKAMAELV